MSSSALLDTVGKLVVALEALSELCFEAGKDDAELVGDRGEFKFERGRSSVEVGEFALGEGGDAVELGGDPVRSSAHAR